MTSRDVAILRAVGAGVVLMTCGCEPELRIDDLCCCDPTAGPRLTQADLIRPISDGLLAHGRWILAVLTTTGRATLDTADRRIEPRGLA